MTSVPIEFILVVLGILIFLLSIWAFLFERKLRAIFKGQKISDVENLLSDIQKQLNELEQFKKEAISGFVNFDKRISRSVGSIETIRFNPFKGSGSGGNQSFSTAFINEHGNGVVITSLHSRERISIFAKPINNRGSEFDLTDEEKEVITRAVESCRKHNLK